MSVEIAIAFYTKWEDIMEQINTDPEAHLVYSATTCYWKIGGPVYRKRDVDLPCGPRGEMLMEMDRAKDFIDAAIDNADYHGKYGLVALMAAYHGNLIVVSTGRPTSFGRWSQYEHILNNMSNLPEIKV